MLGGRYFPLLFLLGATSAFSQQVAYNGGRGTRNPSAGLQWSDRAAGFAYSLADGVLRNRLVNVRHPTARVTLETKF